MEGIQSPKQRPENAELGTEERRVEQVRIRNGVVQSRRDFLKNLGGAGVGVLSAAGVIGFGKKLLDESVRAPEKSPRPTQRPTDAERLVGEDVPEVEMVIEREYTDSAYFSMGVRDRQIELEREMPDIMTRADVITEIEKHFSVPSLPQLVQSELASLMPGLAIAESRLIEDALSEKGAFGYLQVMSKTWKELAQEGEDPRNIVDQVAVTCRLFEQTHTHLMQECSDELMQIQKVFFDDDTEQFQLQFLTPILINAHNAGMGSMATLIQWFVATYKTRESLADPFTETEAICTGYDVFAFLTQLADEEGRVEWYKDKASDYTYRVYGGRDAYEAEVGHREADPPEYLEIAQLD